jgi:hypothetical protein
MATSTQAIRAATFRNMLPRLHALFGWLFVVEDRRRCSCKVIVTSYASSCNVIMHQIRDTPTCHKVNFFFSLLTVFFSGVEEQVEDGGRRFPGGGMYGRHGCVLRGIVSLSILAHSPFSFFENDHLECQDWILQMNHTAFCK